MLHRNRTYGGKDRTRVFKRTFTIFMAHCSFFTYGDGEDGVGITIKVAVVLIVSSVPRCHHVNTA